MVKTKTKEQAVGSQNRTVTPNEAKSALEHCIRLQRPIMMWGAPGIGKSDIVKQIGETQNREVIDIRLPLWEPTDIKGIPYYNSKDNNMVWASPAELPVDPKSNAIVFLDELNSAAPAVQAAAYQLILNRRVGQYVLPKGVSIVAAGNRDSDKGVTYRMPAPLANRFVHVELRVDYDDWMSWATNHHIHPDVVGYCTFAKQDLYDFDPRGSSRSFAITSRYLVSTRRRRRVASMSMIKQTPSFIVTANGCAPPMPPQPPVMVNVPASVPPNFFAATAAKVS